MANPAAVRMASAGPDGYIVSSGVAELKRVLSSPGIVSQFDTWKAQGMTRLISSAIRDLIMNQPLAGQQTQDIAVQYGITQGLEIAYQLMQDPSVIVPGVFGRSAERNPGNMMPAENFDTSAEDAIDKD